ncbi:MAG: hypothetical protein ACRD2N_08155 [Vicinamibacterales bacterium]
MHTRLAVVAVGCLLAGCRAAGPTGPPFRSVATTKQLMNAIVDPAADVVWEAVGTVITPSGTTEIAPASDEEWAAVQNGALALAESGNLLLLPARAGGNEEWMKLAQQLIDLSEKASKAAEGKNAAAVFDLGAEIYGVCTNCHRQFIQAQQSSR